jgi:hypothetical protein
VTEFCFHTFVLRTSPDPVSIGRYQRRRADRAKIFRSAAAQFAASCEFISSTWSGVGWREKSVWIASGCVCPVADVDWSLAGSLAARSSRSSTSPSSHLHSYVECRRQAHDRGRRAHRPHAPTQCPMQAHGHGKGYRLRGQSARRTPAERMPQTGDSGRPLHMASTRRRRWGPPCSSPAHLLSPVVCCVCGSRRRLARACWPV